MKTIQTAMQYAIVPVFYHDDKQVCQHVLQACYDGGIRIFEFTNRGENARDNFKYLRDIVSQSMPNLYLGVGSLITENDAQYFIQNGADFLVSPIFSDAVWKVCLQQQVIYIPGCATPTEMGRAQTMGCEITKLFPGEVFGAQMVSAIMAPASTDSRYAEYLYCWAISKSSDSSSGINWVTTLETSTFV